MNLKKRAISFALASVFTFCTTAFAEDSVNITQRDSYIDAKGNGNLRFITEVGLEAGKTIQKFFTWIVPQFYLDLGDAFGGDTTVEFNGEEALSIQEDAEGKRTAKFTADLMSIPAQLIDQEFFAKSFIIFEDDGTVL